MVEVISFTIGFYVLFGVLALVCEYVDSAMGGGYGTILVPVLLGFNIDRALLVPAILFTEIWTGFGSAILHHVVGNANFRLRYLSKDKKPSRKFFADGGSIAKIEESAHEKKNKRIFEISDDLKISGVLALLGIVGGVVSATVALSINEIAFKTYIGVLVMLMGFLVFFKLKWKFSWWKISGIGLLAAFNKGLSGGGYGPLISSGQMIVDRNPRQAVASTSLSEAVVCVVSLIIYMTIGGSVLSMNFWFLVIALLIGALISVPLAVYTVKYIPIGKMQPIIGFVTMLLGVFTLAKTFAF
ncbi:MAG: sulfite exporter TauE/SafE family protein [Asgard group archaeon]|nr:sulfite exporter TauE/SafE family protein [Asgard group archaeon]